MAGYGWDAQAPGFRENVLFEASASCGSIVLSSGCSHPLPGYCSSENKEKVSLCVIQS